MALGTRHHGVAKEETRLGITIHYRFQPVSFDPRQDPVTAHTRISEATDIAVPVLEAAGIPCELPPPVRDEKSWYQEIVCSGPGQGTEPLRLGWRRLTTDHPWSGAQYSKIQYARDFAHSHIAHCEALMALATAGLVAPDIKDEGEYLPDRNPNRLDISYQHMAAMMGAIGDVLQDMNVSYTAKTPGGGVYDFVPDRPGLASEAEFGKAVRRFQQAAANTRALSNRPD